MSLDFNQIVIAVLESNVANLQLGGDMMDHTLGDLGVDSLDVMLVLMDVQEKTGVAIPDERVDELNTPNKIVAFLKAS